MSKHKKKASKQAGKKGKSVDQNSSSDDPYEQYDSESKNTNSKNDQTEKENQKGSQKKSEISKDTENKKEIVDKSDNKLQTKRTVKLKFCVYAPPEFDVDLYTCQFGIVHSLGEWKRENMIKLDTRKYENGWLITGTQEFKENLSKFEYKYCLVTWDEEIKPFIEYYKGYKNNRTLNFKNYSPDDVHTIYDGIMLPPDEGNKKIWDKITNTLLPKLIKRFFSNDMRKIYFDDTVSAMLNEIPEMDINDKRLGNFKNAKEYMISIINSLNKTLTDHKFGDLIKKYLEILNQHNKLTIFNALALLEYATTNNFQLALNEVILIQSVIMNSTVEDILLFDGIDTNILKKSIFYDLKLIYLFEIWIKLELKTNSIENMIFLDEKFYDLIRPIMNRLPNYDQKIYTEIIMMIQYKRSKVIQFAALPFLIVNNFENQVILNSVSIFEMLGYLCSLIIEIKSIWKRTEIFNRIYYMNYATEVKFLEIISILFDNYISSNDEKLKSTENLEFISKTCYLLFDQILKQIFPSKYSKFIIILTKLYIHSDICYIGKDKIDEVDNFIKSKLNNLKINNNNLLILKYSSFEKEKKETFQNWNSLHELSETSNQNLAKIIKELLEEINLKSFHNLNVTDLVQISHLILKKELKVHTNIEKDVFNALVKKLENQKDLNKLTEFSEYNNYLVNKLIQEVIWKKWPQSDDQFGILNFLFECNNFLRVFLYKNIINNNQILKEKIMQIISLLEQIIDKLFTGEIEIYIFQTLNENKNVFGELYNLFENKLSLKFKEYINLETINKLLEVRFFQIKSFQDFQSLMSNLLNYFKVIKEKNIKIDYQNFEDKLNRLKNYQTNKVTDICECNLDDSLLNDKNFKSGLKHFDEIDKAKIDKIKDFIELSQDNIYLLFYTKEAVDESNKTITVKDFVDLIIDASFTKYNNLGQVLKNGKLELDYFSNKLVKIQKNLKIENENELYKEELEKVMKKAEMSKDQIEICLKKLKNYLNLPKTKEICELLLVIREKEKFSGDFQPLEQIRESLQKTQNKIKYLSEIEDSSMKFYETLDKLSDVKFVKCLEKYAEHFEFIEWLRSNTLNLNELKLLCDFASQSQNEGALEVTRVQSLLLVGTSFAPLIYDLKTNYDLNAISNKEFVSSIVQIFNNFTRNRELPEKFDAISKEKKWLKDIKESIGNTEANSLKQADRINKFGLFDFGLKPNSNVESLTLEDLIRVIVPSDKDQNQKSYTFNQLRELQDKLTLVVGKDPKEQEIIEYFESILESLINLGDIYLDLLQNGNILFLKWNATIYNDEKSSETMKINFGIQNYSENLFAKRKYEKNTINSIDKTLRFLKKCSQEWISHIKIMRNKYVNLNHFKISQLVQLRILMAKFIAKKNSELDLKELLNLLFDIDRDVDAKCIDMANDYAINKICQEPLNSNHANSQNSDLDSLIETLVNDFDFSKELIQQGIKSLNTTDRDKLINYCFESEIQKEKPKDFIVHTSEKIVSGIISNLTSNEDPYNDEQIDDLQEKYDKIWKKFLEYLDLNFEDYVSVYHVGLALDYIKKNSKVLIKREKPSYLEYNKPNLIVCPQDEIISRTLSIYSFSDDQPLPSNDEVLYCNSNTTNEEMELFWTRALTKIETGEKEQKIYSLVNVQDLLYDQAVKAEASYQKLISNHDTNHKYLLCIICSSEREDKSFFVSAFNRFRKNFTMPRTINADLNAYLRKKFRQKEILFQDKFDREVLNVQVITSDRAGVGKSLYIQRQIDYSKLKVNQNLEHLCVSIKKKILNFESVFSILKEFEKKQSKSKLPNIYHVDIAYEVWHEVDYFLFNLLCLGIVVNSNGKIFRRSPRDLYLVEIMSPKFRPKDNVNDDSSESLHSILNILPSLKCIGPHQSYEHISENSQLARDICPLLFDETILNSDLIQRPCKYLNALDRSENIDNIVFSANDTLDAKTCLNLLLKHLECQSPSWSEIIHFAKFLNSQLIDCEKCVYCDPALVGEDLPGFKTFVVKFMVQMSHDFALPSLQISDRSALQLVDKNEVEFQLNQLKMRRKWENDPHPYLFFNSDGNTFTFFGLYVNRTTGQLIDHEKNKELFQGRLSLSRNLIHGLYIQDKKILYEKISEMSKEEKINKLLSVMGINCSQVIDPDPSYELTMDNLLKILAIYMRLRADIPVIIMGETGCGKTRLCRYMCDLIKYSHKNVNNMYLVKVHGGTTTEELTRHVRKAEDLARKNLQMDSRIFTILFFDEANSTEAIGTIKEIMCDSRVNGIPLDKRCGLKIIAACNPYKKHSDETIQNFDKSGLGFYVDINETEEKLGNLPMRHLVYRVQPLPASMLPMIWDFGQLNDQVEYLYIKQIVYKKLEEKQVYSNKDMDLIVKVLHKSQKFMREQKNECSFVSLRDIQRVLKIIQWLMQKGDKIFQHLNTKSNRSLANEDMFIRSSCLSNLDQTDDEEEDIVLDDKKQNNDHESLSENENENEHLLSSIILALNACYHVGLQSEESRNNYQIQISQCLNIDKDYFLKEIDNCYEAFLNEIQLPDAIARNQALKENIFMILICIELKIPLFIIGKPGSSKSLAKTLIANKMQGSDRYRSSLLSTFKEAHLITFQCSPMSTSEMILNTFRYCAKYQFERRNDLDRYTSVVVLDEIGLAEASPSMPLKTLHPLLEDGVYFEPKEEKQLMKKLQNENLYGKKWHKIGFIAISNWILDPAKMNRGIFVNRNSPSTLELQDTVIGICKNDQRVLQKLTSQCLIESLSKAYLKLCQNARNKIREFFGLRDFYALIKMIYWHAKENDSNEINWQFLERVIKRNFGGLVDLDPIDTFIKQFQVDKINLSPSKTNINVIDLVKEALLKKTTEDENRYLLLLSQNDNALDLINNFVLSELDNDSKNSKIKIIFGSSFPNDQKYSQICRKIHQIKLSMELGKTVILLNLENLYESLYDALNQFYYKFGDAAKFVDLGLGTARVKCLVHDDFRLIVVADKKSVYNSKKYPIPLVNRLEKHILSIDSILNSKLKNIVRFVEKWLLDFTSISEKNGRETRPTWKKLSAKLMPSDIFIGYTDETISSLVYKMAKDNFEKILLNDYEDQDWLTISEKVQQMVKIVLLQSCTSDGVFRLKFEKETNNSKFDLDFVFDNYYKFQHHENFSSFLEAYLLETTKPNFIQITTHSKLLSYQSIDKTKASFKIESLLSFDSQHQFVQVLKEFYKNETRCDKMPSVLIVQCEYGHIYTDLINCARFTIIDEYTKHFSSFIPQDFYVVFIIQIPKIAGGCFTGFQTSKWFCYHIDDLQNNTCVDNVLSYENKSLSQVFDESLPEKNEKSFKIFINILKSVIFDACSKVTDVYSNMHSNCFNGNKNRAIERLEKLLDMFENQNLCQKFLPILIKHIAQLQMEKEIELERNTAEESKSWINKVSKVNDVIKYATLKNSCQNYIETRVSDLFSSILALIDCNRNLDFLLQSEPQWILDFWFKIFDDREILNLKYMTNFDRKKEFICNNSFECASHFKLKLPFSWIIKDYFDKLIQLEHFRNERIQIEKNDKENFEQLQNAFENSFFKKKLDSFFDCYSQKEKNDFITAYVNDFILLSFSEPFISLNHFTVVKDRLIYYCKNNYCRLQNEFKFIIGLHCSFKKLTMEINLFTKFAKIDQKCIEIVYKSDNKESNISFLAARILCEQYLNVRTKMEQDEWFEWFEKVQKTSSLIEKMINLSTIDKNETFEKFDSLWQRTTLLKLYIENVCIKENDLYNRCFQFWKIFDDEKKVDFKKKTTFEKFINFLSLIFKFGKNLMKKFSKKCEGCESKEPSKLFTTSDCPSCFVCSGCIEKTKLNKKCQKCTKNQKFELDLSFQLSIENKKYEDKVNSLKINFNTFYMDVVKILCFERASDILPEDEVIDLMIENLLPKPIGETEGPVLDFGPTPSIKSSLFQLLLNFNEDAIRRHLMKILTKSEDYLRQNYAIPDLISLKLMYLNSFEDNLYSRSSLIKSDENFKHDIQLAVGTLNTALRETDEMDDEVSKLKFLAKIRFCLTTCSKLVSNIDKKNGIQMDLIHLMEQFISQNKGWFQMFLVKSIFRIHGRAETIKIASQDIFKNLIPNDLVTQTDNIPKTFAILGKQYKEIKKLIEDCLITENFENLSKHAGHNNFVDFFLCVFEITYSDNISQNEKFKKLIEHLKIVFPNNKEHFDLLLDRNNLPIGSRQNLNIQFLLMHVFVISLKNKNGTLFQPFVNLINNPEKYAECYLPSIPHDDDFEAYQAFINNPNETIEWFCCPNGHLYTIGECFKPMQKSTCPTCGAPIGGSSHVLDAGNIKAEKVTEKPSKGYSFENADKESIRNMGQFNTLFIRLLLDCCMFISTFKNPQQIKKIVYLPNKNTNNLQEYFMNEIEKTFKKLSTCLQHSPEESLLLFHQFIHRIGLKTCSPKWKITNNREDRNKFEQKLCEFIKDEIFENKSVDNVIDELNTILKESAPDSDKLFRIAYDLIELPENENYFNQKKFWVFRRQITLNLMIQHFSIISTKEKTTNFRLLSEFIEKIDTLKAIKYLPSLFNMSKIFHKIFNRQIDSQTCSRTSLNDMLKKQSIFSNDLLLKQIEDGVKNFIKVWKMLSAEILSKCSKKNIENLNKILQDREINHFGIPIGFFLPSTKNEGSLIYSLFFYLINVHNEFIQFYVGNILGKKVNENTVTIDLDNVTKSDLISFSPEKDILRLVYIHSNYSLEECQNLNLEFNFNKIQSAIERKIIADKPLIDTKSIPLIEFSDSIRNDLKRFKNLEDKIKQQKLDFLIKEKISLFYKQPDQLNDMIRKLSTIIDFIISTGCSEETKIIDYAINTLKMTNIQDRTSINKLITELDVSYLKSLWNLLNLHRAILLTEHGQDPFDLLNDAFRYPIQENEGENFEELATKIMAKKYPQPEEMLILLEFMYNCIVHWLIPNSESYEASKNDDSALWNGEMSIKDVFDELINEMDILKDHIDFSLINIENIKLKNFYHLWKLCVHFFLKNSRS